MKILERKDHSGWTHVFTCHKCESKLEAEPEDIKGQYHQGYTDPRETNGVAAYWTYDVTCAVCGQTHTISEVNVPKTLIIETQKKSTHSDPFQH